MATRTKQRASEDATASPREEATEGTARPSASAAERALAQVEGELAALPAERLVQPEVELPVVVALVLERAPAIRAHREAIVAALPAHPIHRLDDLETYARAAWFANVVHAYATGAGADAPALQAEARRLREDLVIAARALAHRGLLDRGEVEKMSEGATAVEVAGDLGALAALFSRAWPKVSGKTAVELREVERAAQLGPMVLAAADAQSRAERPGVDAADQRLRAFVLLVEAYESCRRALAYVRWTEGDAETIAPSIYRKKRGRKPKQAPSNDLNGLSDASGAAAEADDAQG